MYFGKSKKKLKLYAPDDKEGAVRCAENILCYGDNTESRLREKLADRGFLPETAEHAVSEMKRQGFLDDARYMERLYSRAVASGKYGLRRITAMLSEKGFSNEMISGMIPALSADTDFTQIACRLFEKSWRGDREKTAQVLIRAGFTYGEAAAAAREYAESHRE